MKVIEKGMKKNGFCTRFSNIRNYLEPLIFYLRGDSTLIAIYRIVNVHRELSIRYNLIYSTVHFTSNFQDDVSFKTTAYTWFAEFNRGPSSHMNEIKEESLISPFARKHQCSA